MIEVCGIIFMMKSENGQYEVYSWLKKDQGGGAERTGESPYP
jgi:hypothetical protein|tara:strand:+ start:3408 stop:3533 length:126 start_codon:yes stop_codon:yes gene_type:complete